MRNQKITSLVPYLFVVMALMSLMFLNLNGDIQELTISEYDKLLESSKVETTNVTISDVVISIDGYYDGGDDTLVPYTLTVPNTEQNNDTWMEKIYAGSTEVTVLDAYETNVFWDLVGQIVPFLLFGALAFFLLSRMNGGNNNKAFEFGRSRARLEGDIKVRFDDVAGCDEEKEEMQELIAYLKSPKKFEKMGARIPKGVLMVGAPGTGKTLLAKAVAGEAEVPFYSISGSDFVEMFVGVGASRVRDMFKKATQTAPCIIFIDEIDAVGRQRGAGLGGGHDEREQTLNQLLVEMDGITDNSGIVIVAATNRPDVLDPALLRPGRFDRQITVSLPDRRGREAILKVHARNKKFGDDIDLAALAKRTPGFSGADLENVLNEAAILAVRANREIVVMEDLDEAIDRVIAGPAKKSKKYTEKEKRLVAIHEVGHTIIGLKLDGSDTVQKVTIIPRGVAGGYNLMTPKEETFLQTKKDLLARITGLLGGRVAEEVFVDEISTGASNDIERATQIAREMVMTYGMSDLGPIQYEHSSGNVFLGRDYSATKNYSGQVAFEIDTEVRRLIDTAYDSAKKIIKENKKLIEQIVDVLIEQETLTAEQIDNIVAGRKFNEFAEVKVEKESE